MDEYLIVQDMGAPRCCELRNAMYGEPKLTTDSCVEVCDIPYDYNSMSIRSY